MTQDNDGEQTSHFLSISTEEETLVEEAIDEAFDDVEKALPVIERRLQLSAEDSFPALRTGLESLWNFFEAIRLIREKGDFAGALDLLPLSAEGFDRVEQRELRDLSVGMGVYARSVVELHALNIGKALELLAEVKDYLRSAGRYGGSFEPMIDHMEPDALFLAGSQSMMSLDLTNAKILFDKAAQASEAVSEKYYEEGEPLYYTFRGIAHFYKAWRAFSQASNEFFRFAYDKVAAEKDLASDAKLARDLLKKGAQDVVYENVLHLSKALVQLLELEGELSVLMMSVLHSTFKPDLRILAHLRQKARTASTTVSQAGPQAVGLVRYVEQIAGQIDNLQRLAKPTKRDFGVFSGLVSSALFLPLFLAISWGNSAFFVGLDAATLITTCLILALIGGFGFGALRFKSLIFPASPKIAN